MSAIKDGGPAFPRPAGDTGPCIDPQYNHAQRGMTLRDYFAAKAMHAEIVTCGVPGEACKALVDAAARDGIDPVRKMARNAYEMADAMLAAREVHP